MDVDEVAIADWCDPVLVHLNDFSSVLLDCEVVLQDRSMDLPVGLVLDLHDKVFPDDADDLLLDLGDLPAVGVLDGHGITDPELAVLDAIERRSRAAGLEVEGFSQAHHLVVGIVGGSSPLVAAAHAVDGEGVSKGQELFLHGKCLGGVVVLVGRGARVGGAAAFGFGAAGNGYSETGSGSHDNGGFHSGGYVLSAFLPVLSAGLSAAFSSQSSSEWHG